MNASLNLFNLVFACYLFPSFEKRYGSAYEIFINKTQPIFDIHNLGHRTLLLEWLNEWGCRQFETDYHNEISEELSKWSLKYEETLPKINQCLINMSEKEIDDAAISYASLLKVSFPCSRGKKTTGPTGASKILFALRKDVYPIWDIPMRNEYKNCPTYNEYMKLSKRELATLKTECEKNRIRLDELPALLGRKNSSLLKLLDEYRWVYITQGVTPPTIDELHKWVGWASNVNA